MGGAYEPRRAQRDTRSVEAPKATASPARALSVDQVVRVLKAAEGTRLHGFFVVAANTAMRRGELGASRWDAVDLDAGECDRTSGDR